MIYELFTKENLKLRLVISFKPKKEKKIMTILSVNHCQMFDLVFLTLGVF